MKTSKYVFDPLHGFISEDKDKMRLHEGINFEKISPFLRALLVTDGTVTKFLEAYLWESVMVERLYQKLIVLKREIPCIGLRKGDKAIKRKVLLRGRNSGQVFTFAESYIRLDKLKKSVRNDIEKGKIGIGELLRDKRVETYREIMDYGYKRAGKLSAYFGGGPDDILLFRTYVIFTGKKPVIMITEHFQDKVSSRLV